MTTNADFKRLIRVRMGETGETYTAARAALLRHTRPASESASPAAATAVTTAAAALPAKATFYDKTIRAFFDGPRLRAIPAKRKPRVVVLLEVLSRFEAGRRYDETDVNAILRTAHDDVAFLRRELVDYRYLCRDGGSYWITETDPERDATEAQEVPADEGARLAALRQR